MVQSWLWGSQIAVKKVNTNLATEITCLQKNIVALENLASSENLAPPCPSENFGFCDVVLGISNISFDNNMQWMNKTWI